MSLPHATEDIQWGDNLLFRIGGKMFCVANMEPPHTFSFKCTPEEFAELSQAPGIIPAPYMARHNWVLIEQSTALRWPEIQRLIRGSYALVRATLPRKKQQQLDSAQPRPKRAK